MDFRERKTFKWQELRAAKAMAAGPPSPCLAHQQEAQVRALLMGGAQHCCGTTEKHGSQRTQHHWSHALRNLHAFWRFELSNISAFCVLCLKSSNILPNCTIYKIMWKLREGSGEKKIRIKTKTLNFCPWTITYVIYWAVYPMIIDHSRILCTSRAFHCLLQGESLLRKHCICYPHVIQFSWQYQFLYV